MWLGAFTLRDAGSHQKEGAMPDDEIDSGTTETTEEQQSAQADDTLGDAGKKALEAERDARKTAEKANKDLQKAVKELQDRDKTEAQKKDDRITELERALAERDSALATKDQDLTRRDVAEKTGVPAHLVTGSSREEMEASAKAAIEWRGTKKTVTTGLRSGASKTDDSSTAKERAASALRGLGSNR